MAEVIWTDPALQELNDLAEYIALDNPAAASQLVQEVFAKAERLEEFPQSGHVPEELTHSAYRELHSVYRELIVPPCRIFYREDKGKVFVLHVMRDARQLKTYLLYTR